MDSLLEEIKRKQQITDERASIKKQLASATDSGEIERLKSDLRDKEAIIDAIEGDRIREKEDYLLEPSTNLFFMQLPPECTEEQISQTFGQFGRIASVKVMYPRTEFDRARNLLTGFVAYTTREDAEKAKATMEGTMWNGIEIRMGKTDTNDPIPVTLPFSPPHIKLSTKDTFRRTTPVFGLNLTKSST